MSGLTKMSTATYTTKRSPTETGGKGGASVAHLTGLASVPIMPTKDKDSSPLGVRDPISGQVKQLLETFIEYQTHVDSSVTVTQLPDIRDGDVLVGNSIDYKVRRVWSWPATTTLLSYLNVVLEESQ